MIFVLQVDHAQSGLPVVCMENVRNKILPCSHFHSRFAEVGVPLAVIIVPVEHISLEIVLVVQKIKGDSLIFQHIDTAILIPPG